MRKLLFILTATLVTFLAHSQNEVLAQNYFEKGDFEKARLIYEDLLKKQPSHSQYFQRVIECHQQMESFEQAELLIRERMNRYKQAYLLVELGYNFQLQKRVKEAEENYREALKKVQENPSNAYSVGNLFERKSLLDWVLKTYQTALETDPKLNFNFQLAMVYGQLGQMDLMIERFLEEAYENPRNAVAVQNNLARFMNEDTESTFSDMLRRALLVRAQKSQDIYWNQFLSWFFVQQQDYGKAFIQEKAIYRRAPENFSNIVNLAELALEEGDKEIAREILEFVLENTRDLELQMTAHYHLLSMRMEQIEEKNKPAFLAELEIILKKYGISPYSLDLQLLKAHFLSFHMGKPREGQEVLRRALELPLNRYQAAEVKMELADIFLLEEKFNQALLYYSQIEEELKNDAIGHEASFKAAQTSYFKEDFDWALVQLRVLKSASTQLIANDALELFLLINDNTTVDSTQAALKIMARGDFLLYQKRIPEAIREFEQIVGEHPDDEITDAALLRLGESYEKIGDYNKALSYYQQIIDEYQESIYRDEAFYYSGNLYYYQLKDAEKAKDLYEQVIFNHQDSIHFVEARKKFRMIRGDMHL